MNVNGIGIATGGVQLPQTDPRARGVSTERGAPALQPAQTRPVAGAEPRPGAAGPVPVEPPPGTDPELWAVLSGDERAFFAKVGAMGPLTYGHILTSGRGEAPVSRGGRLDVRV